MFSLVRLLRRITIRLQKEGNKEYERVAQHIGKISTRTNSKESIESDDDSSNTEEYAVLEMHSTCSVETELVLTSVSRQMFCQSALQPDVQRSVYISELCN